MSVYQDLNALQSIDLQVFAFHLIQCIHELNTFVCLIVNEWNVQVLQLHWLQRFRFVEKLGFDAAFGDPNLGQERAVFSHRIIFLQTRSFNSLLSLWIEWMLYMLQSLVKVFFHWWETKSHGFYHCICRKMRGVHETIVFHPNENLLSHSCIFFDSIAAWFFFFTWRKFILISFNFLFFSIIHLENSPRIMFNGKA